MRLDAKTHAVSWTRYIERWCREDTEKVPLLPKWPVPVNLSELRCFLHLTGYYRRHVEGYSGLTFLTKIGHMFVRTDDCQRAFETSKEKLSSSCLTIETGLSSIPTRAIDPLGQFSRNYKTSETKSLLTQADILAAPK